MRLSPENRAIIEAAIEAAEARTNAELAVVVADVSDDYAGFPLVWAGAAALLSGGALALARPLTSAPTLFMIEAAVFVAAAALFSVPRWRAHFAPRWVRLARAQWMAELQFAARVEHRTADAVGLLLYVSVAERFAAIRVDQRITTALPTDVWELVLSDFTRAMRAGATVPAVVAAIGRCAEILALHFPPVPGQRNEISNRVVQF